MKLGKLLGAASGEGGGGGVNLVSGHSDSWALEEITIAASKIVAHFEGPLLAAGYTTPLELSK